MALNKQNKTKATIMENEKISELTGPMPGSHSTNSENSNALAIQGQLSFFFKTRLPELLKTMFLKPTIGTSALFTNPHADSYFSALILMGLTFVLYIVVPYLMLGSTGRQYIGFGAMLALGLTVLIFLLLVSVSAFGIKAIAGKADFKTELLNGGLCSIPLLLLLVIALLAKIFSGGNSFLLTSSSLFNLFTGSSIIVALFSLYMFLMLINIVLQSLKAGGLKDALSWYVSPLVILLSFFIAIKITSAMF